MAPFRCCECDEHIDSLEALEAHASVEHLQWVPYGCFYCRMFKPTVEQLRRHCLAKHAGQTFLTVTAPDEDKQRRLRLIIEQSHASRTPGISSGPAATSSIFEADKQRRLSHNIDRSSISSLSANSGAPPPTATSTPVCQFQLGSMCKLEGADVVDLADDVGGATPTNHSLSIPLERITDDTTTPSGKPAQSSRSSRLPSNSKKATKRKASPATSRSRSGQKRSIAESAKRQPLAKSRKPSATSRSDMNDSSTSNRLLQPSEISRRDLRYCNTCKQSTANSSGHILEKHMHKFGLRCHKCNFGTYHDYALFERHVVERHSDARPSETLDDRRPGLKRQIREWQNKCHPLLPEYRQPRARTPQGKGKVAKKRKSCPPQSTGVSVEFVQAFDKRVCRLCPGVDIGDRARYHVFKEHLKRPALQCRYCDFSSESRADEVKYHAKKVHAGCDVDQAVVDKRADYAEEVKQLYRKCFVLKDDSSPAESPEPGQKTPERKLEVKQDKADNDNKCRKCGAMAEKKLHHVCVVHLEEALFRCQFCGFKSNDKAAAVKDHIKNSSHPTARVIDNRVALRDTMSEHYKRCFGEEALKRSRILNQPTLPVLPAASVSQVVADDTMPVVVEKVLINDYEIENQGQGAEAADEADSTASTVIAEHCYASDDRNSSVIVLSLMNGEQVNTRSSARQKASTNDTASCCSEVLAEHGSKTRVVKAEQQLT